MSFTARLLTRSEVDAAAWDRFVAESPQQYLYYYTWYLDAVSPRWSAVVVSDGAVRVAQWPLPLRKKGPLTYSFQPLLTQFLGIIFCPLPALRHKRYHFIKTAMEAALEALPPLFALDVNLHPELSYFLPFYWKKYRLAPRLTYWLPLEEGFDVLQKNYSSSVLNHLRKAQKSGLHLIETQDVGTLVELALREKIYNPPQAATFRRVWLEVRQRQTGFLLHALDPSGKVCSAAAFIWDGPRLIFYAIVQDAAEKASGSNALLVTEGIRRAGAGGVRWFDFEGSMLPGVEQYFRSFNPEAKQYLKVRKIRFAWLFELLGKF